MKLNVAYDPTPHPRTERTQQIMDLFGLDSDAERQVIADNLEINLHPGEIALFVGPSGSGKSSLLRETARTLQQDAEVLWVDRLWLPKKPLVEALRLGRSRNALKLLSQCGLSEASLLLRTPSELSDGQRFRFRLAYAIARLRRRARKRPESTTTKTDNGSPESSTTTSEDIPPSENQPRWLAADEFSAPLERPLAQVIAYNLRRLSRLTGFGFLLATTHDDVIEALDPDVLVRCELNGQPSVTRRSELLFQSRHDNLLLRRLPPLFAGLWLSEATKSDWPYFARWHYRGPRLGPVKRATILWRQDEPIGICVFCSPAAELRPRNDYFPVEEGARRNYARYLESLNRRLWVLSRVVLHPNLRGASMAAPFVQKSCQTCNVPWIETLAVMGHLNPIFEKAGFQKISTCQPHPRRRPKIYGSGRPAANTGQTGAVYYLFDNRGKR